MILMKTNIVYFRKNAFKCIYQCVDAIFSTIRYLQLSLSVSPSALFLFPPTWHLLNFKTEYAVYTCSIAVKNATY